MKVALVINAHHCNHQSTGLGLMQSLWMAMEACAWFKFPFGTPVFTVLRIFSDQRPSHLQPATIVANYYGGNEPVALSIVARKMGQYPISETIGSTLATLINEADRPFNLIFGCFWQGSASQLLGHWNIPTPETWPVSNHPALVLIDTTLKSVEIKPVPPDGGE